MIVSSCAFIGILTPFIGTKESIHPCCPSKMNQACDPESENEAYVVVSFGTQTNNDATHLRQLSPA